MRVLPLALPLLILLVALRIADSPHGSDFEISCSVCHSPKGWELDQEIYSFDHNTTKLPLEGQHTSINCKLCHPTLVFSEAGTECFSCHTGNDFSNISSECISCHQTDYNATTNPSHVAAGLPMDCLLCHTTLPGWKPADFSIHDSQFFPIYSGRHKGEWDNCIDCHTNTANYSVFTCIDCHEHNRTDMDDKHLGEVSGYQYNSIACLECHPTGNND